MANSVAEQLKSFKFITELCNLDKDSTKLLYDFYFKYAEDPVALQLFDTVQKLIPQMKEFEDCLKGCDANNFAVYFTQSRPLIVSTKDALTSLRVYPNIILNAGVTSSSLGSLTITDNILNCFSDFFKAYEKDKTDLHFESKWGTDKIEKRLNSYLDMDTARALSRNLTFGDRFKDDKIRDLAVKLDIARRPLELLYCDKPEDYTTMYGSGPSSCMSAGGNGHGNWKFLTLKGLCPASFYYYFKYTRGVYIQQRGNITARSILYKTSGDAAKEVWQYGRVYSSNSEMSSKFIKALHDAGYTSMNGSKYAPPDKYTMTIPGIDMTMGGVNDYGAPFPYFDNMGYYGKGFTAKFDKETKEFTLTYNVNVNERDVVPISGRGGHIRGQDYTKRECERCKSHSYNPNYGNWIATSDGHLFCGPPCAEKKGYVEVIQGNGHSTWALEDKDLIVSESGTRFSNLKAAYQCGYLPQLADLGVIPEEFGTKLTHRGYQVADPVMGERYMVSQSKVGYRFEYINKVPCLDAVTKTSKLVFDTADSLIEELAAA